jgi:hypothetical protein
MALLRKFLRLPAADRWLLIKAALLLEAIAVGKRLLPFRILRRLLARAADTPTGPGHTDRLSPDKFAWAVEAANRHTPGTKACLTQALAVQVLLARAGHPALLHLGVARGERGQFRAHAWVESEGKVIIGGPGLEDFTPLTILEGGGS